MDLAEPSPQAPYGKRGASRVLLRNQCQVSSAQAKYRAATIRVWLVARNVCRFWCRQRVEKLAVGLLPERLCKATIRSYDSPRHLPTHHHRSSSTQEEVPTYE
jgi:hypothetical protein